MSESMVSDEVFSRHNRFIQLMEDRRELDTVSELASAKREGRAEGLAEGLTKGEATGGVTLACGNILN